MKKKFTAFITILSAFALCCLLAGCGCSASNGSGSGSGSGDAANADGTSTSADGSTDGGADGDGEASDDSAYEGADEEQTEVSELNVTAGDDDLCTLTVNSKAVDAAGYVGFNVTIVNKTGDSLDLYADGSFNINGTSCTAYVSETIAANATQEAFVYFAKSAVPDMASFTNVSGKLTLYDAAGEEDVIRTYDIAF